MIGGQKKLVFGGEKGKKGKKRPFERKEQNFPIHALFLKGKVPTRSSSQRKERVKTRVNQILNRCFLPFKSPSEEGYGHS